MAAWNVAYGKKSVPAIGPVVSGCTMSADNQSITVTFNVSIGGGTDSLLFKGYNKTLRASAMQVHVNKTFDAAAESANHKAPSGKAFETNWDTVDMSAGTDGTNSIVIDLKSLGYTPSIVTGIRYARYVWRGCETARECGATNRMR
jgi:hypothetical protein